MQKPLKVNVICYGQSGTGKTHTLFGSMREPGIAQLMLETIFAYIEATSDKEFLIRAAFFEIFNESINDLTAVTKRTCNWLILQKVLL